jgi:hypothetical protein
MRQKNREIPPPPPPEDLSERSKALWSAVVVTRARSAGRLAVLEEALRSLDRADEARHLLAQQGLLNVTKTTGAVHLNPLSKVEKEHRGLFVQLWVGLGLNFDVDVDGRLGSPHF